MKQQLKHYRYMVWILPAAVAVMIFMFSAQPADESSQLSDGVIMKIIDFITAIHPAFDPEYFLERMSTPVRKAAHITEYAVFYLTLLWAWYVTGIRERKWVGCTMLIVFLYACTDEFHQVFVDGRAGRFTDVMIDCSGGLVISAILILVMRRKKSK